MNNILNLNAAKFEYFNGDIHYGYTISDDYDMSFDINAEDMIEDDTALIKYVISTADSSTNDMLEHMIGEEKGLNINGCWYDWDEIKDLFKED